MSDLVVLLAIVSVLLAFAAIVVTVMIHLSKKDDHWRDEVTKTLADIRINQGEHGVRLADVERRLDTGGH